MTQQRRTPLEATLEIRLLREGDQNTKFFHLRASLRRKINHIDKLQDISSEWVTWSQEIGRLVVNYFEELFKTSRRNISIWEHDNLWRIVPRKVTDDMKIKLSAPVTEMEIQDATRVDFWYPVICNMRGLLVSCKRDVEHPYSTII